MSITVADVRGALPDRASRISASKLLYACNHQIRPDIRNDVYTTFEADFAETAEITIVAGQYQYALPADYFDIYLPFNEKSPVKDASNNPLHKGYSGDTKDSNSPFGARVYNITSGYINFPKKSVDNGDFVVGEVLTLDYLKKIPDLTKEDESDELPFGDRLQEIMFPIYVAGAAFFLFTDTKKLTDRQLQATNYATAKANVFSMVS